MGILCFGIRPACKWGDHMTEGHSRKEWGGGHLKKDPATHNIQFMISQYKPC